MYTRLDELLRIYDGILLSSPHNMRYFSGFSGGEGAVWISRTKRVIMTDSRYTEQAQTEAKCFEVLETNDYFGTACELVRTEKPDLILFEDEAVNAAVYFRICKLLEGIELKSGSAQLNRLRMVKTEEEVALMAKAEGIACRAFERILDFIEPGRTEKAVASELEYYIRCEGGDRAAFETIAISGTRCSLPHGVPTDKVIEKGDFVTMDFGCMLGGYCSDMTRTVVVGKADAKQKEVYNAVKTAQQTGLDFIRAGVCGRDADNAARSVIENLGYGQYFRHSLGHGVGLLIHELPNLSPKSEITLEENMIVTCEPGIYIPGFGGVRIEDMICVKTGGNLNLTDATKELIEL